MKRNYLILLVCLLAGCFVGCSDDGDDYDIEKIFTEEQEGIEKYLAKIDGDIIKYPIDFTSGRVDNIYVFNLNNAPNEIEAKEGDWTLIDYDVYGINRLNQSEFLLNSTDMSKCVGANVVPYYSLGGPVYQGVSDASIEGILTSNLRENGSGSMLVPSRILGRDGVSKLFKIKVKKVIKEKLITYEKTLMTNFLDTVDNKLELRSVPSSNGSDTIAQIAILKSNPANLQVEATDSVKIYYEGYILDEFSHPLRQFIKMEVKNAMFEHMADLKTRGLKMTVIGMHKEDEAYILLPYVMGYGKDGGFLLTRQCSVPEYSTLVYRIKIIDVKKNKKD